jgi:hypothetical protein
MSDPEAVGFDSGVLQAYEEASEGGIEEGEPVTPGSGSVCRPEGYVDADASHVEEIGIDWTLKSTNWYEFTGTGDPVVVRVRGNWLFGAVLYRSRAPLASPLAEDALSCSRIGFDGLDARMEADTEPGTRYLVQVGDWKYFGQKVAGRFYLLNVAKVALNRTRARAVEMPLSSPVRINNFGGSLESPAPTCSNSRGTFEGGRSVWGKVEVPAVGSLHVAVEPEEVSFSGPAMILLYPEGGTSPVACSVGPLSVAGNLTTELNSSVLPGRYSVQLMTAVKSPENPAVSNEERWRVTASFLPNLDIDGDGYFRPGDCRDDNPAVHPDAVDISDNGVDENCDGEDARRDTDKDGIPDYRDRCPAKSSKGIDTNGDGCRDPQQLSLVAQVRLTLSRGRLHLASLFVKTDRGARVTLSCSRRACSDETKHVRNDREQFGDTFARSVPDGTVLTLTATKPGFIGVAKRYQLSTTGMRLLRQWCTAPGRRGKKTPCA